MVNSYRKGLTEAEPVVSPDTRVITIATGNPGPAYSYLQRVVREHGGAFESVSDEETFRALHVLAKMEGLSVEPASATAFAGLFKLLNAGVVKRDEVIVVNCSGHTFPVEKFLLDDDWIKVVQTEAPQPDVPPTAPPPRSRATTGGLLGALDQLDRRVRKIAIVEDNADAARLLRRILQTQGDFQITEAHNGQDGLDLIRREHPDLVLLDLMMPDMDGFAVLDQLEAQGMLGSLPVIVITAKELTREDRQRLEGQIEGLLQKGSFMDDDLVEGIQALLGKG
jgi:threonine synthase